MAKKTEPRDDRVTVRFTRENLAKIALQANADGVPIASWIAQASLEKINQKPGRLSRSRSRGKDR